MSNRDKPNVCKQREKVLESTNDNVNARQQRTHSPSGEPIAITKRNPGHRNGRNSTSYPWKSRYHAQENLPVNHDTICQLSDDLSKLIHNFDVNETKAKEHTKHKESKKKITEQNQTEQIKKILADCLQKFDERPGSSKAYSNSSNPTSFTLGKPDIFMGCTGTKHNSLKYSPDPLKSPTLLRSYLSGSAPTTEEYISERRNVSNSLISSDSIHHSIYLESGREKRKCLLLYLSSVAAEGQVVIYTNSIPGAESLLHFLLKHGFKTNAVHSRMLMAESNWILSEFSLKSFKILLCAEDHYHAYPAHFRWVKTIINYDLPIYNPEENWDIRNGIVDFSDSLPVHIYTFIKKSCQMDTELVKLLQLDSGDQHREEELIAQLNERSMINSVK